MAKAWAQRYNNATIDQRALHCIVTAVGPGVRDGSGAGERGREGRLKGSTMIDDTLAQAEEHMQKAIAHLGENFATVRTGRANAMLLDRIKVDYYGVMTPINQMAAVKTPDAHMLLIEPWDKSTLSSISQAIQSSDLGVTPSNDGSAIRLPFPQPTEERRRELVKQCRSYAEEARVGIRNARRDANSAIEKMKKDTEISEDDAKRGEAECQRLTDKYIAEVEEVLKKKETEVMEV